MKRILSAAALAAAALFAAAPSQADPVVSFSPSSSHVDIGSFIDVEMWISGLDSEILSAFDINLLFNEAIVDNIVVSHNAVVTGFGGVDDAYFDTAFGSGNTGAIDGSYLDDDTLAASQPNSFLLLTFTMKGMSDGVTTLSLGLNPDFERNFVGRRAESLDVQVGTACIAVGTGSCDNGHNVPEPASWGLAGLALLAAGSTARRRREGRSAD